MSSPPELSVVCKNCGSEVSPYVTECPYCGERIRKRAPQLQRDGDEIRVKEGRREKRLRKKAERSDRARARLPRMPNFEGDGLERRPIVVIGILAISAVLMVVQRAVPATLSEVGAIIGPLEGEVWRYLTSAYVYEDLGALIVVGAGIAIFGTALERRLGSLPVAMMAVGFATLSAAAAVATGSLVVAGGNSIALGMVGVWTALGYGQRDDYGEAVSDWRAAAAAAAVLLLLPLVEVTADPVAGVVGGALGLAVGGALVWRAGRTG